MSCRYRKRETLSGRRLGNKISTCNNSRHSRSRTGMEKVYQRSDEAFDAPLAEVVMLLNVGTGRYHELNAVAGRIWELLAAPRSEDDLVTALTAEYEVEPTECRIQVADFLEKLRARKLLAGD